MSTYSRVSLGLLLVLQGLTAAAQPAALVRDIKPGNSGRPGLRSAFELTALNGTVIFAGEDGASAGLWRTDGTETGTAMVREVWRPRGFTPFRSRVLFFVEEEDGGNALWGTDGTSAGTDRLVALPAGLQPQYWETASTSEALYFTATDAEAGAELWRSDGTEQGTFRVADIVPGPSGSYPHDLVALNNTVFFLANDGIHGIQLWRTLGTSATTWVLTNVVAWAQRDPFEHFAVAGGALYFVSSIHSLPFRLWRSDGTPAGTTVMQEFTGVEGIAGVAALGDMVYVGLSAAGPELWRTDGTTAGTVPIDVIPDRWMVRALGAANGKLWFFAYPCSRCAPLQYTSSESPFALWMSDGTTPGTVGLSSEFLRPTDGPRTGFTAVGNLVFFAANLGGDSDKELWVTDGTQRGTRKVKDLATTTYGYGPEQLTAAEERLVFTYDGFSGYPGLYASDGTSVGTQFVLPSPNFGVWGPLVPLGDLVFFDGDDGSTGWELWRSDGTTDGTRLTRDIWPGLGSTYPYGLCAFGSDLFFGANRSTPLAAFWKTDGTEAGTVVVKDGFTLGQVFPVGSSLFFSRSNASYPYTNALWMTDGVPGHEVPILGAPAPSSYWTDLDGLLLWPATTPTRGLELWRSDGTASGTTYFDIRPGSAGSDPRHLATVGASAYFSADAGGYGRELWKAGPSTVTLVKDIAAGPASSDPEPAVSVGGIGFFAANDGVSGLELWRSDGTSEGTYHVADIAPGGASSRPRNLTNVGGLLFFVANDGVHGTELWRSDGSAAGTWMVNDIAPGAIGSQPEQLVAANGWLFFTALDAATGRELWVSDGSAAGTQLVQDISPGPRGSAILTLAATGRRLFFDADDGVNGREIWTMPLDHIFRSGFETVLPWSGSLSPGRDSAAGHADP